MRLLWMTPGSSSSTPAMRNPSSTASRRSSSVPSDAGRVAGRMVADMPAGTQTRLERRQPLGHGARAAAEGLCYSAAPGERLGAIAEEPWNDHDDRHEDEALHAGRPRARGPAVG